MAYSYGPMAYSFGPFRLPAIPMDVLFLCNNSYGHMAYSCAMLVAGAYSHCLIPMDLMAYSYAPFRFPVGLFQWPIPMGLLLWAYAHDGLGVWAYSFGHIPMTAYSMVAYSCDCLYGQAPL